MIIDLIKLLSNSSDYDSCIKFVKKEFLPVEAWLVISAMPAYFKDTGELQVSDWNDFFTRMAMAQPAAKGLELAKILCENLAKDTNPVNPDVIQTFQNRCYAEELAEESIKIAEGRSNSFVKIQDIFDKYKRASVKLEKELRDVEVEDMETSLSSIKTTGMRWNLDCLNTVFGPLNNEFILLASRPDGGKTTMLAHECWYIAKQLADGKQVIWFNNEEHIRKVKLRVIQSYLGLTRHDILSDVVSAVRRYEHDFGKDKIIFIDDANHISKIEKCLDKYNPGLVIIDQLYKVQGTFNNKNDVEAERFRKLCEWAREIAKHTAPVIASNQLDGRAEGVRYPPMDTLYGSKTGAQGEADGILLIGKTPVDGDKRFIYTPKNKLTGSNDYFECELLKDLARFKQL